MVVNKNKKFTFLFGTRRVWNLITTSAAAAIQLFLCKKKSKENKNQKKINKSPKSQNLVSTQ
jgi:hypothetical protein